MIIIFFVAKQLQTQRRKMKIQTYKNNYKLQKIQNQNIDILPVKLSSKECETKLPDMFKTLQESQNAAQFCHNLSFVSI